MKRWERLGWILFLALVAVACAMEENTAVPTLAVVAELRVTYAVVTVIATPTSSALATTATAPMPPTFTRPASVTPAPTVALTPDSPTAQATAVSLTATAPTTTPGISTAVVAATSTAVANGVVAPTTIAVTSLPPPPVGAAAPRIYETTLTISTYGYEAAFQPTSPEDPIYPYPRLNFDLIGPPAPRAYRAVVLENGFVSITILPELGGRIYRWVDRATGRRLLYENPVIKPTEWGYRGWWLAAGGIEWAFPVDEHGLNEWRPWSYSTGTTAYGSSVTVSNVEERTGMEVGATISLDSGHAYLVIQPWVRNNTSSAQPYQLWLNAMLALNNNTISPQTQLIVPATEVLIHSSSDGGVPASGSSMSWPFYDGRDMSRYGNWQGWLGFFVPNVSAGFVSVYDHASDQGIVRAFNPGWPAGSKFFGPATISPATWTDDNSNYLELWSGATSSFWGYATLNPGESFSWTEFWYPVHGMGGLTHANRAAALRLVETSTGAEVSVAVSGGVSGEVTLWVGGQRVAAWPMTIYPGQTFRASWMRPEGMVGALGLQLVREDGSVVAQTGFVP